MTKDDKMKEFLSYPRGKHDDLLDGLFYANKGSYAPYHETQDEQKPLLGKMRSRIDDWLIA